MKTWWKTLSKTTQTILIAILLISTAGIVAFAAFQAFQTTDTRPGDISPYPFVEIEMTITGFEGHAIPGEDITGQATISNNGRGPGMAYIRFSYPVISEDAGAAGSVYTWSVGPGWTVIEEGQGYTIYGYNSPLDADGVTSSLLDVITMKAISNSQYKALGNDVNVGFVGYMAECETYGTDSVTAWDRAHE